MIGPHGQTTIAKALELKKPVLTDLHRNTQGIIRLDLIIPLFTDSENKKDLCGILFYRINPDQFLYPLIQSWPTPSKSCETILIRLEGNRILFLNELRNKKNTALKYYRPISQTTFSEANVALDSDGNMEGLDYRGVNVLANLQRISGSPWLIIAKVDKEEILEPIRRQAFWIFLFTTFLILLTGIIVFIIWKLHISNSEKEKLQLVKQYKADAMIVSKLAFWEFDIDRNVFILNDRFFELLQTSIEEQGSYETSIDEFSNKFIHPSFYQQIKDVIQQAIETKDPDFQVRLEKPLIKATGEECWMTIWFRIKKDNHGRTLKLYGANQDITEKHQIEEALRESEEIYRRLVNSLPDIIFRCDLTGNILFINDSNVQFYGFEDKNELIGRNIFSFIAPEDMEKALLNTKLMFQQYLGPVEYKLILANGSIADFEVNGDVLLNSEGVPFGMVFILRDITERKTFEASLNAAKEKAEESDRLKSSFLANMSHEIRTPMNGILGFSELLDDDSLSHDERQKYIKVISENSRHLLGVINDIIDISKIDSNQLSINPVPFNLNSLMDELYLTYENEKIVCGKAHLEIRMNKSLDDSKSVIISDDIRLRQILYNLLGNAMKFTHKGFIKFEYTLIGDQLQFMVQDTGKGIAPDKQAIVFERFRQEEESYTRFFGGSGLGLSISKGLVHLLGGKIWMESQEGIGTTFYFTIKYQPQ